jgi:hypothetical protein
MHQDGSSSARARSARIRASHDYEATELESMRRRGKALEDRQRPRPTLMARLTATFARTGRWNADPAQAASEIDEGIAGITLNE